MIIDLYPANDRQVQALLEKGTKEMHMRMTRLADLNGNDNHVQIAVAGSAKTDGTLASFLMALQSESRNENSIFHRMTAHEISEMEYYRTGVSQDGQGPELIRLISSTKGVKRHEKELGGRFFMLPRKSGIVDIIFVPERHLIKYQRAGTFREWGSAVILNLEDKTPEASGILRFQGDDLDELLHSESWDMDMLIKAFGLQRRIKRGKDGEILRDERGNPVMGKIGERISQSELLYQISEAGVLDMTDRKPELLKQRVEDLTKSQNRIRPMKWRR